MGGPLAMGFGVVLASSLGTAFLPPTTALGAGVWSIALYGGLILFGGFILYDTQKVRQYTDSHPIVGHIPSNVLSTFRSAGGPVLQLPTAIATFATLEYLPEKSLSMIEWETGYTDSKKCHI